MRNYLPEGYTGSKQIPQKLSETVILQQLKDALITQKTLEGKAVLCDSLHNLYVDLGGGVKGFIPREECAIGIDDNTTKDVAIISRVNKQISFKVVDFSCDENGKAVAVLSRKKAQIECFEQYVCHLNRGDVVPARITHLEAFGAFVDIGCGVISLIPIDLISVSRINHSKDRFFVGQNIFVVIVDVDIEEKKVYLSHKELLGTWEQNVNLFSKDQTVCGIVRSVENYGVFVELTPNLAGLAELTADVHVGQSATVFIKNIIPEKMKIKLILVDNFYDENAYNKLNYFITDGNVKEFNYSPKMSSKTITTTLY